MKKLTNFVFLFALVCLLSFTLWAEEIAAKSRISSVTVYPDRAAVIREARLDLAQGKHSVVFDCLPSTLTVSSIRVSGRGTAEARILGMDISRQFLESAFLPEIEKLKASVEDVKREMTKVKDRMDVLNSQENFLKSIESSSLDRASLEVALGKPDIQSWEKIIDFLSGKLQEIKNLKQEEQKILSALEIRLDNLKKKLDSIEPQKPRETRKVEVLLEVSRTGKLCLDLSYVVNDACWAPLYILRALPDSSEMDITASANILQKSGEDWENVKVLLSTSSPAISVEPPTLRPWLLSLYTPPPERKRKERVIGGVVGGVLGGTYGKVVGPVPAEMAPATIAESGLHFNFAIKREVQIPSDGSPHKLPIDTRMLKTRYDYFSVPKLKEAAYLRGTFRNVLPYPLLTGNADLFIQQDFIGSAQLSYVAPEEETEIFFGEDSQVVIKYEQAKKEKSGPGFLGKNEKTMLVYRISVQNFRKNPVEIEIVDQLPVSQNAKIEVKNLSINPAPAKKDEKGMLTWSLTLEPQEKKEILIGFTVEYPKDDHIIGI